MLTDHIVCIRYAITLMLRGLNSFEAVVKAENFAQCIFRISC